MRVDEGYYWGVFDAHAEIIGAYRNASDAMKAFLENPDAVSMNIYIPERINTEEAECEQ